MRSTISEQEEATINEQLNDNDDDQTAVEESLLEKDWCVSITIMCLLLPQVPQSRKMTFEIYSAIIIITKLIV